MRLVDVILLYIGLTLLTIGALGNGAVAPGGPGGAFEGKEITGSLGPLCYAGSPPGPEVFETFIGGKCMEAGVIASSNGMDNASAGIVFRNWRGFALKGNESHALRVSIESIRPIEPMNVRRLLASNMSIEEVRDEIRREEGAVTHQGAMKIGEEVYMLSDIKLSPSGNYTALDADLGEQRRQGSQNGTAMLGHISAKLAEHDDAEVSVGTLVINGGRYAGEYRVLLSEQGPERTMMMSMDPGGNTNGPGPD